MKQIPFHIVLALTILLQTSCVTNKKITYLQHEGAPETVMPTATVQAYTIRPGDNLFVRVLTPNPVASEMFNSLPNTSFGAGMSDMGTALISYTVNADSSITLPYAGRVKVAGKNTDQAGEAIEGVLKDYVADAAVRVRLVNNYVNLIGEVRNPGRYPIYKEQMNIFEAVAMGNDLTDFSNRQKIQIIRQTAEGMTVREFSMNDRSIIGSEYFYVMPNDVIYAPPMRGRFFKLDAFPYSVILSTITTFVLIYNVVR